MEVRVSGLADSGASGTLPPPSVDALREDEALIDAQLVAIWLTVATSRATVVLDLRQADIGEDGNTAVLVVEGICTVSWDGHPWLPGWLAWNVGSSIPMWAGELFTLELGFEHPSSSGKWPRFLVVGERASFYIGDVPGLPDAPPDFGSDSEEVIRRGMVGVDSLFVVRRVSTVP